MKKAILSGLLILSLSALSACCNLQMPKGQPGEPPNIDTCNPGHELSKHCHGK